MDFHAFMKVDYPVYAGQAVTTLILCRIGYRGHIYTNPTLLLPCRTSQNKKEQPPHMYLYVVYYLANRIGESHLLFSHPAQVLPIKYQVVRKIGVALQSHWSTHQVVPRYSIEVLVATNRSAPATYFRCHFHVDLVLMPFNILE